jgi:hypothetical protein
MVRRPSWLCAVEGQSADSYAQFVGRQLEFAVEMGAGDGGRKQQRTRFVDRDPQVFDLLEGEIEPGSKPCCGGAQHRQIDADGRYLEPDDVNGWHPGVTTYRTHGRQGPSGGHRVSPGLAAARVGHSVLLA